MNELERIQAAAANGLNKQEIESLLGHKLSAEEYEEFNKTKALLKLRAKKDKEDAKKRKNNSQSLAVNPQNDKLTPPISKRFTKEQVLDVIWRTHGLTAAICSSLDCSYNQWQVYLRRRPEIRAIQEEARQGIVDMAEKRLLENLNSADDQLAQRACEFILKHLGTSRGWSDLHPAQQINVDKDGVITIQQIFGIDNNEQ